MGPILPLVWGPRTMIKETILVGVVTFVSAQHGTAYSWRQRSSDLASGVCRRHARMRPRKERHVACEVDCTARLVDEEAEAELARPTQRSTGGCSCRAPRR